MESLKIILSLERKGKEKETTHQLEQIITQKYLEMLISKIAKICYGCTIFYKLIMVKFSNTTITYSTFQSNENNNKEKWNSDAATKGWFAEYNWDLRGKLINNDVTFRKVTGKNLIILF